MSLITYGWFSSHSKFQLPWKIDCDALSDDDIEGLAKLIAWKFAFGRVVGIPRGGLRLAKALESHVTKDYPVLIVDDVLTTGRSMITMRKNYNLLRPEPLPRLGMAYIYR